MGLSMSEISLICFGDSLTAGYQKEAGPVGQELYEPPGGFLQHWLGGRGKILVRGICGEVTAEMIQRFPRDVINQKPKSVVILGGTNDLGLNVAPQQVCLNLQHMYHMALRAGIQPVGVTVPSIYIEEDGVAQARGGAEERIPVWAKTYIENRRILNRMITEACVALHMGCIDLFTKTVEGPAQLLAPGYSSDGLHFNTKGYEVFAQLIWQHVLAETFGDLPLRP